MNEIKIFFGKIKYKILSPLIIIILVSFVLINYQTGNWYVQTIDFLNGRGIKDFQFLDSLTGFAVTYSKSFMDTGYILKTTNGGNNWYINYFAFYGFNRLQFINQNTGFSCGGWGVGGMYICKTTNRGINWFSINPPPGLECEGMSVINQDTMWIADSESLTGGIFKTTNGGTSWVRQLSGGNQTTDIYMYNANIGFVGALGAYFFKTTNGGTDWILLSTNISFLDIHFIDSLTGYRTQGNVYKTTDGGYNWIYQPLPNVQLGTFTDHNVRSFSFINRDTIWGVGGVVDYYPNGARGLIYKTTNGGLNWGYQLPDTHTVPVVRYFKIRSSDKMHLWAYFTNRGAHTITGGDSTIYTGVNNSTSNTNPESYKLYQNYPNPFNSTTKIKYEIPSALPSPRASIRDLNVSLKIFDVLGREAATLVNEIQSPGTYEVEWNASQYPSGVYFYRLQTEGYSETRKMLYTK